MLRALVLFQQGIQASHKLQLSQGSSEESRSGQILGLGRTIDRAYLPEPDVHGIAAVGFYLVRAQLMCMETVEVAQREEHLWTRLSMCLRELWDTGLWSLLDTVYREHGTRSGHKHVRTVATASAERSRSSTTVPKTLV